MTRTSESSSQVALVALLIAAITGIAGDYLLRSDQPGINIWCLYLVFQLLIILMARWYDLRISRASLALLMLAGVALFSFAWRDAPALNLLAFASAVTAAGLAAWMGQGISLLRSTTAQYVFGLARVVVGTWFSATLLVFSDVKWSGMEGAASPSRTLRVGRGLVLALPPLVVFGALFNAADPIFHNLYSSVFDLDMVSVISHLAVMGAIGWFVAGYLRELTLAGQGDRTEPFHLAGGRWEFSEVAVALATVNALFLLFVVVQVRALFGGNEFILSQTGLTYAEYAREGFFQMTAAAALVLPMLLFAEWISRRKGQREERSFRALALLLLFLLTLVLGSAIHRMRTYQLSYGLTELRVYTMAFMAWLVPVLGWFALTILRGRRDRFAAGAIGIGFVVVLVLHLVNPDRLIAATNLARAAEGRSFDAAYAATLSRDAWPQLIAALPRLSPADRCQLVRRIGEQHYDWRSWNLARLRANELVQRHAGELNAWRSSCPPLTSSSGD